MDLLTAQNKTCSSAFLNLYSTFSDAPDPFPLLEASVESFVAQEDTLPKLVAENADLQKRVKKLTTDLEESERRLENETNSRRELTDASGSRIKEVEESWSRVMEEKQSNWEAKEKVLEDKIENQDRLLKELKAGYDVAQNLSQNGASTNENILRANAAELELVSTELEKATSRLAELEARNEQLRVELAHMVSESGRDRSKWTIEDDPTFIRLQNENSALLRKLESTNYEKESKIRDWEEKVRHIERQKSALETLNNDLKAKLDQRSDYHELRRELEMLRSIELETNNDEDESSTINGSVKPEQGQSLEQLLLSRNKKLSSELTVLRVSQQELQQQLKTLQEECSKTNGELASSRKLCSTLEDDLLRMQEEAASVLPSSAMSVAGTYTSRYPQSSRRGRSSPTSSIISGYDPRSPSLWEGGRAGEPIGGGSGILPMIQAQRDRFKQKNSQLEEELSKTYATVTSLRQEIASLQKDNLNLYEKARYMSAYNRGPNATSSAAFSQAPSHTAIQISSDSVSSSGRYRADYEAKISPFAAFRGRESARAYKRMTLPERMIFSVTRMVLATRTSRNLFAAYCLALHLLVIVMLYWTGTVEVEKHVKYLGEATAAVADDAGLRNTQAENGNWQLEGLT